MKEIRTESALVIGETTDNLPRSKANICAIIAKKYVNINMKAEYKNNPKVIESPVFILFNVISRLFVKRVPRP